ncbi:hypothetical protein SAMN06265222_101195 [Neorhodopirellula lusitana]|uniref:Secreted protein n=2 Tax=Neorhodopirellula lusitana TaxID=445327 RepID=A0ABY1PN68_9BACT|nr:hypothetical protein SAMN06265222_101195 [Neorhodopirellula lusitana]
MKQFQWTFLFSVFLMPLAGCGGGSEGEIATQDEIANYMEEHPELDMEDVEEPPEEKWEN